MSDAGRPQASTDLIDAFCDQLWLQDGLAPASLASYRRDLVAWSAWLGARGLLAADRGDVEAWLADQFRAKAKATSIARRLSTLRRFYRLQLERATVREDPTVRVARARKNHGSFRNCCPKRRSRRCWRRRTSNPRWVCAIAR